MDIPGGADDSRCVPDAFTAADDLRDVESRRLRSLVDVDLDVAEALHADVYQLITPGGAVESKETYLKAIASGALDYRVFEPSSDVAVRVMGNAGILRYQARIEVSVDGGLDQGLFWHTDYYERRREHWQAVWSHATRIRS